MTIALDLVGKTFGRISVIERSVNDSHGQSRWLCRCDCGKDFITTGARLKSGHTKSCGCRRGQNILLAVTKHGHSRKSKSKTYLTWEAMKTRCSPKSVNARNYFKRGIQVCDRWLKFENFLEDMGEHPGQGFSIDRIDNDLGYSKENCQWASRDQQSSNRRVTLGTIRNGEWMSIAEFSQRYFMSYASALYLIESRYGCVRRGEA
jgi:hypothetical protein